MICSEKIILDKTLEGWNTVIIILFVNKCSYKFKLFQPINNLIFNIFSIIFIFFLSKVFIDVQKHLFQLKQLGTSTCFIRSADSCE